jgi:hypothetical protein
MNYHVHPSRGHGQRHKRWRDEIGVGVTEALVIVSIAAAVFLAAVPTLKRFFGGTFPAARCVALNTAYKFALQQYRVDHGPDAQLPADDKTVTDVVQCLNEFSAALDQVISQNPSDIALRQQVEQLKGLQKQLQEIGMCRITNFGPQEKEVGGVETVKVEAYIPFTDGTASANLTAPLQVGEAGLSRDGSGFTWSGTITLNGENAKPGPNPISLSATSRGGASCAAGPVNFTWKAVAPVKIKSFTANATSIQPGQQVQLSWETENAKNTTLGPLAGAGTGTVNTTNGSLSVSPKEDTTYTLTASNAGGSVSQSVKVTVEKAAGGVNITSPSNNAEVTSDTVVVNGTVSPVPPPELRSVQVGVNGAGTAIPIGADGSFSTTVSLPKKSTKEKLVINNPSPGAFSSCEFASERISATNTANPEDVKNIITATVTLADNSTAQAAPVTVRHALLLTGFHMSWGGDCPPGRSADTTLNITLQAGKATPTLDTADCGRFTGSPGVCTGIVNVSVDTSQGLVVGPPANWVITVQESCE